MHDPKGRSWVWGVLSEESIAREESIPRGTDSSEEWIPWHGIEDFIYFFILCGVTLLRFTTHFHLEEHKQVIFSMVFAGYALSRVIHRI